MFIFCLLLFSVSSFAAPVSNAGLLLLEKSQTPGFTTPEFRSSYHCQIYQYKVIKIKAQDVYLITTEVKSTVGQNLWDLLKAVYDAPKIKTTGPTDIPTTSYNIYAVGGKKLKNPQNFSQQGEFNIKTDTAEARQLVKFIDSVCL